MLVHRLQALHKIGVQGTVNEQTPQRGAALPRRTHRREHHRSQSQGHISTGAHHSRIVAAQLQQAAFKTLGTGLPHHPPHWGGAGGTDQAHRRRFDQGLAHIGMAQHHTGNGWRVTFCLQRLLQQLVQGQGAQRGFL